VKIEIFEIKNGNVISEMDTDVEALIVNLYNKYRDKIELSKVNVLDKELMKKHKDITKNIEKSGIEILPLIKVDKKVMGQDEFLQFVQKKL